MGRWTWILVTMLWSLPVWAVELPGAATPAMLPAPATSAAGEATVQAILSVEGAGLEVDGDFTAAKDGRATVKVKPGKHSVVVRQPGYFAVQGAVEVPAAGQVELTAQAQRFERDRRPALALMVGGGVLALGAVALDAAGTYNSLGGDHLHWPMLGVGLACFAGGTYWLKAIRDEEFDPPVGQGTLQVRVAVGPGGAQVVGRF